MNCWSRLVLVCCVLLGACGVGAGTLAQFRTLLGDIEVELYDDQRPVTVQNFKRLVQSGAYQNTFLHRVEPRFVAQGGGFTVLSRSSTNVFGPSWSLLGVVPNFNNITNEFGVGGCLSNTNGTLAMAKGPNDPNSANCQWFFNLANNSANLDNQNGGFTVFGHVVRDTGPAECGGILGLFNLISYGSGLVNMGWWFPTDPASTNLFTTLPVTYFSGPYLPRYIDLFYVDVSLLSVQIAATNGQQLISWNSVNGKTNVVEYTATIPPNWNTLLVTNGNGGRFTATNAVADAFRFYRVRVIY
jgi:cyclophilin family peptidyl-prolyl cis-trans isomerase